MPQESDTEGGVITLPADYQKFGPNGSDVSAKVLTTAAFELSDVEGNFDASTLMPDVDELPEATIESWLLNSAPPEAWVPLKTKRMKVKVRGLSEEERKDINRKAPRVMNRSTRRAEPDQDWINMELVRRCLLAPHVPNQDMLLKAMAGDLAHVAEEIGRISGFNIQGDALD